MGICLETSQQKYADEPKARNGSLQLRCPLVGHSCLDSWQAGLLERNSSGRFARRNGLKRLGSWLHGSDGTACIINTRLTFWPI